MTITSDQVNYLVLRYLAESGFDHTVFALKNEMHNAEQLESAWASKVPTGYLIDSLQRALMFQECLAQIDENGVEKETSSPAPVTLIPGSSSIGSSQVLQQNGGAPAKKPSVEQEVTQVTKRKQSPPRTSQKIGNGNVDTVMADSEPEPQVIRKSTTKQFTRLLRLDGHTGPLDQCTWHPEQSNVMATSSKDGTARIWALPPDGGVQASSTLLNCSSSRTGDKSVTSLSWNSTGTLLATGSYDGTIRIWTQAGVKQNRDLIFHAGPIFALKWSQRGDFLLSGAADGMVGVWHTSLGTLQQKWDLKSSVMDLEWISDALFLSACQDGSLRMWQLNREVNVKLYNNQNSRLSVFRWNGMINLGATGAVDSLVKIWRADSEHPTQILKYHKSPILALEWAPKDDGDHRILASSSKDGKVCVLDAVKGELLHVLHHDRTLFSLHFSRENFLVTAGEEGEVTVWNGEKGTMVVVRQCPELGKIHQVKFSNQGNRIAAASEKGGVVLYMP